MPNEHVTKAVAFNVTPAFPGGLLQVNPGVEAFHALGAASVILAFVRERLIDGVAEGGGVDADFAMVLALLADTARALYLSAGAEA